MLLYSVIIFYHVLISNVMIVSDGIMYLVGFS